MEKVTNMSTYNYLTFCISPFLNADNRTRKHKEIIIYVPRILIYS
jgi:hypothetical protein